MQSSHIKYRHTQLISVLYFEYILFFANVIRLYLQSEVVCLWQDTQGYMWVIYIYIDGENPMADH